MSDSINLVCKKCREYLWVGQFPYGKPERAYVYTVPDAAKKHARFLARHLGHELIVADDTTFDRLDSFEMPLLEFEEDISPT